MKSKKHFIYLGAVMAVCVAVTVVGFNALKQVPVRAANVLVNEDQLAKYKSVTSIKVGGEKLTGDSNSFVRYNILYIDLDKVFPIISEKLGIRNTNNDYNKLFDEFSKLWHYTKIVGAANAKEGQVYRNSATPDKIVFSRYGGVITVPDIYVYKTDATSTVTLDDSTRVGIEVDNDRYYVPLHFLEAMPGITAEISGGELSINVKKITDYNSISNGRVYRENKVYKGYVGDEENALWRKEALKRIEKYRKSDITIDVVNSAGEVIKATTNVKLEMTANSFNFGTSTDNSSYTTIWTDDAKHVSSKDLNTRYFNLIESGNMFTNTLSSNYDTARIKFIETATSKGFNNLRGHVFFWDRSVGFEPVVVYKAGDTGNLETAYNSFKASNSGLSNAQLGEKILKLLDDTDVLEYKNNALLNAITMHSISDLKKSGKLSQDELRTIFLPALKRKFSNTVIEYIKRSVKYNNISEWEIFNEFGRHEYFKYYLYDEKFLDESENFFTVTNGTVKYPTTMNVETQYPDKAIAYSEDYINFLSDCMKAFREAYAKSGKDFVKLIANDTSLDGRVVENNGKLGFISAVEREIGLLNTLQSRGNKLDAFGAQYHVNGRLYNTPMSYYNNIQRVASHLGNIMAKVEEYDNVPADATYDSPSSQYMTDELKARYLRDTLIASYSNIKSDEFIMWVYNDKRNFTNAEREMYKSVVEPWLNDKVTMSMTQESAKHKYKMRLYKGEYALTVTAKGCSTYTGQIKITGVKTFKVTLNCPATGTPPKASEPITEVSDAGSDVPQDIAVNKIVTIGEDNKEEVSLAPGDEVKFVVVVTNTSNDTMNDVVISDSLPEGMTLVEGSVMRVSFSDGVATETQILSDDLNYIIDEIAAGDFVQIIYKAKVEENIEKGTELVTNATVVYDDDKVQGGKSLRIAVADVEESDLWKTCQANPDLEECQETSKIGVAEIIGIVVLVAGAAASVVYYVLAKRKLERVTNENLE